MNDITLLHLSLIPQIGPAVIKRLLNLSDEEIYQAHEGHLGKLGLSAHQIQVLRTGLCDKDMLYAEQERMARYDIQCITLQSSQYPSCLRAIHMPPVVLYVQGSVEILQRPALAMVGSRAANAYGRVVVEKLLPSVVAEQWVVVSGGARGIDSQVHHETIRYGGSTVAVLGSGLLRPYPREHVPLFKQIVASGGCVVSPFPLTMSPLAGNFPARNRIIAGLARACVVVQAAQKSGALITALQALSEGRDVGVVPGNITDDLSAGCHALLREGAQPITSPDDLRELMGCMMHREEVPSSVAVPRRSELEEACRTPRSFDDLLSLVQGDEQELHQRLWELQIAGSIEQTATGLWRCV